MTASRPRHRGRHATPVLRVSHSPDLALLTVDTPGANTLSVTRGVVSRVEHQGGAHSGVELLAAQIDAAANAGNSGGPVLASGRVVGVAYQGLGGKLVAYRWDGEATLDASRFHWVPTS